MNLQDIFRHLTPDNQALLLACAQVACVAEEAGKQKNREQTERESHE
jgi:hypothetical protein